MNTFVRTISTISLVLILLFLSFLILMWVIPGRSFAKVFLTPSLCPGSCMIGGGGGDFSLGTQSFNSIGIRYEWPEQMNLNSSDTIVVSLAPKASETMAYESTPTPGGNYHVAEATPSFIEGTPFVQIDGTPSPTSIGQTYGPVYQTFADAQLLTNTFDIKTFQPSEQPLKQSVVTWVWNVRPTNLGRQIINLDVDFLWRPIGKGQVIERQIWQTQITINVTQPFVDPGQISIGTTISGALAAGGVITTIITAFITFILDHFRSQSGEGKGGSKKPEEENAAITVASLLSALEYLRDKNGEAGKAGQQKLDTEDQSRASGQQGDQEGKIQVQTAQLQQGRRASFSDIRTLLQRNKKTLSIFVRVLLILLAIVIIGASIFVYYTKVLRPAQISAHATAVIVHATATTQAALTATVTTEQHLLATSTNGSAALDDPLNSTSDNGWIEDSNCMFRGGSYHATIREQSYLYVCREPLTSFTNFAYEVQLSIGPGSTGCLIFRYNVVGHMSSFTGFCTDNNGSYSFITHAINDTGFRYLKVGSTTAIKSGTHAINTFTVIAQGIHYTIYINKKHTLALTDNTTNQGTIGVGIIDNYGNSGLADVAFSHAKVWKLRG